MKGNLARQACEEIHPSGFLDYRLFFDALYQWAKRQSDGYSYQRFATDLGFGPTTVMHQIIKGHRRLTLKAAAGIIEALSLRGVERRYLLAMIEYCNTKRADRRDELFDAMVALRHDVLPSEIDRNTLAYFSEWYHPVVRELVGTPAFRSDPEWIAATIMPRITPSEATASLKLLAELGLIVYDQERGRHVLTQTRVSTGARVKTMAIVSYHQQMIDLGKAALTRVPGKRRDISALTLSVSEAGMQRLKDMIHTFQTQLLDAAESAPGDDIVQVNMQLFPFTGK